MGSVPVNDENLGVHPGGKNNSASDDIFAIEQPTGRQSILRQTENLPNKTVPKGGKVCFQTPRRDPVSKRILSPSKSVKMDNLVECMRAMDSLRLDSNTTPQKATETIAGHNNDDSSHPDDEMPIKSTGGYTLDFDNLDAMDPFQGSEKLVLSPMRPSIEDLPLSQNQPEAAFKEAGEPETALDETLPFNRSVENSLAEVSSTESSVVTVMRNSCLEDQQSSIATPDKQPPAVASLNVTQEEAPATASSAAPSAEEAPLHSRGAYSMDFDNLDTIDPFQTASKIPDEVPLGQPLPGPPEASPVASPVRTNPAPTNPAPLEASPVKTNPAPLEASPVKTNPAPLEASPVKTNPAPLEASPVKTNPAPLEASPVKTNPAPLEASPVKTNPAPLEASPVRTNPGPPEASPVQKDPSPQQASPVKTNPENIVELQKEVKEPSTTAEAEPVATVTPVSNEITKAPDSEATGNSGDPPAKGGPVKLEFNFDDGAELKPKPRPKKFGKRPPLAKASGKKPTLEVQPAPQREPSVAAVGVEVEAPLPKAAYSFDFDMLDDPNFNPFGASVKMDNACGVKSSPAGKVPAATEELAVPAQGSQQGSPQVPTRALSPCPAGHATNTEAIDAHGEIPQQEEPISIPAPDLGTKLEAACRMPEPVDFGQQHDWTSQTLLVETNEEFVPGSTFISSDLDGQMDYLEQFGSTNFKESALRKQSLYLKFDPLMKESPKKAGAPTVNINPPRPAALASRFEAPRTVQQPPTINDFKLIDVPATRIETTMLESLVPPTSTDEAIIDVLKYSQKDMDAAIARVRAEAKETEAMLTLKYDKLYEDDQEMRKVFSEFEQTVPKMMAEWQGERDRDRAQAQAKLKEALAEKEQVSQELSALEISFSELFKRLEKYKGVLEGYKKNEETLKGCAQEYLVRIRKEEQRYQTLKSYAEEKISKANEEIGEVRSRLKAEVSGLQAQLRREQLKCQSLENNYDQKVKEAVELTKLCDELIAQVQTG